MSLGWKRSDTQSPESQFFVSSSGFVWSLKVDWICTIFVHNFAVFPAEAGFRKLGRSRAGSGKENGKNIIKIDTNSIQIRSSYKAAAAKKNWP